MTGAVKDELARDPITNGSSLMLPDYSYFSKFRARRKKLGQLSMKKIVNGLKKPAVSEANCVSGTTSCQCNANLVLESTLVPKNVQTGLGVREYRGTSKRLVIKPTGIACA
ncbi:MAG: hypothetical protein MI923_30065 [Phycisphaerales bacterium]|nr:hypothetical protein [Phycisphaerales bacterium]